MLHLAQARLLLLRDGQQACQLYLKECSCGLEQYGPIVTIQLKQDIRLLKWEILDLRVTRVTKARRV